MATRSFSAAAATDCSADAEEPVAAAPVEQPASAARVTAVAAARIICLNILSVSVVVWMVWK
jgi:hypothetical protein